jgi:RNA polymerase sigma factor (sigma-70 family)
MTGRPKRERRVLSDVEQERAHSLMQRYIWLAKKVAASYYHQHELHDHFTFNDVQEIAYLGLCETATKYVRKGFYKKQEWQERSYLESGIEHAIIDYVRHEDSIRNAKEKLTILGVTDFFRKPRLASLEEYEVYEEEQGEFEQAEIEVYEDTDPLNVLRAFSATLPPSERVAQDALIDAAERGQRPTHAELAARCGITERHVYNLLASIKEKRHAWLRKRREAAYPASALAAGS